MFCINTEILRHAYGELNNIGDELSSVSNVSNDICLELFNNNVCFVQIKKAFDRILCQLDEEIKDMQRLSGSLLEIVDCYDETDAEIITQGRCLGDSKGVSMQNFDEIIKRMSALNISFVE